MYDVHAFLSSPSCFKSRKRCTWRLANSQKRPSTALFKPQNDNASCCSENHKYCFPTNSRVLNWTVQYFTSQALPARGMWLRLKPPIRDVASPLISRDMYVTFVSGDKSGLHFVSWATGVVIVIHGMDTSTPSVWLCWIYQTGTLHALSRWAARVLYLRQFEL